MRIAAVTRALPPHYYDQETLVEALREHWKRRSGNRDFRRLEALHRKVLVGGRHLALTLDGYRSMSGFGEANDAWIQCARQLGARAVESALEAACVPRDRVGALLFVTTTGVATPSIDALLMNDLEFPAAVKRMPLFGLGCVAGAAGLARAADYVRSFPDQAAVLLSVELCSLTMQTSDVSIANQIATGLFGDGAAAVVVTGEGLDRRGPKVLASRSNFYRDTEDVMGWNVSQDGLRVVLSPEVPEMARRHLGRDVEEFLGEQGVSREEIKAWICHPGGPKVIEAMEATLGLTNGELDPTWSSLRETGNLSSASVLFILADTMEQHAPRPGELGLMLAMGPGFCSELLLLQW
jgi:alkylresorcinol/alkylpyrone synthase